MTRREKRGQEQSPCSDFMDMLRCLISCRIITILLLLTPAPTLQRGPQGHNLHLLANKCFFEHTSLVFSSTRTMLFLVIPKSRGTSLFLPFTFSCSTNRHKLPLI